jgi:hypothetical protein
MALNRWLSSWSYLSTVGSGRGSVGSTTTGPSWSRIGVIRFNASDSGFGPVSDRPSALRASTATRSADGACSREMPVQQQYLDQDPRSGGVAEPVAAQRPERVMGLGERAGGAGLLQRRGAGQRARFALQHLHSDPDPATAHLAPRPVHGRRSVGGRRRW